MKPLGGTSTSCELDLGFVISSLTGVFTPPKDEAEFAKLRSGGDRCPDLLYSQMNGKPIPWAIAEAGSPGGNE